MSHKAEFFQGHWYDEGLHFETAAEATEYAKSKGILPYRVSLAQETDFNTGNVRNLPVNYRFVDGKLVPYKAPAKNGSMSWEEYCLAGGGIGMPLNMPVAPAGCNCIVCKAFGYDFNP